MQQDRLVYDHTRRQGSDFMHLMVIASPGHCRESLVALLCTLPAVNIEVVTAMPTRNLDEKGNICSLDLQYPLDDFIPEIVIVDQSSMDCHQTGLFERVKMDWPQARYIVLVDNYPGINRNHLQGADCVLSLSTPAGELLTAIKQVLERLVQASQSGEQPKELRKACGKPNPCINQPESMLASRLPIASTIN